jgi:hypothetical protein
MSDGLLNFLFLHGGVITLLLLSLGAMVLVASVLLYRHTQRKYASTWTFTETRTQGALGGPYREGEIAVPSLILGDTPLLSRVAALSGHALAFYLAIFLPFFLPIASSFPTQRASLS